MTVFWLASVLAGAAWGLHASQPPADQKSTQTPYQANTQDEPEETLWDPDSWSPITFFTFSVALFSFVLAIATGGLWIMSIRTARRQLRAYLCITPQGLFLRPNQTAVVDCVVKNYGLTPAFEINHEFGMSVFPHPLPDGFIFPPADRTVPLGSAVFPSHEMFSWFHTYVPTEDEVDGVEAGRMRFHVWGMTSYRDAFNRRRWTRFSGSVGGSDFEKTQQAVRAGVDESEIPGFRWHWGPNHNEAS